MIQSLLFLALIATGLTACARMEAWQFKVINAQSLWPAGPTTAPTNAEGLDSGVVTPYSTINPEREIWVATYGSDADSGTMFEPKKTLRAALAVATPGTAIMVKNGVYADAVVMIGLAGSAGKPIWIRSADGKGAAQIGAVRMTAVNGIVLEGFKIGGGLIVDATASKSSTNVIVQNNLITGGSADVILAELAINIYLVANDISVGPNGNGISMSGTHGVLIADNFIHDLHGSPTKNDGIEMKGDMQDVLVQNNVIDRVDGVALEISGTRITARANLLRGGRRAAILGGCTSCTLEKNDLPQVTGAAADVLVNDADALFTPSDMKLLSNCVYRGAWLANETGVGIVNQSNGPEACH